MAFSILALSLYGIFVRWDSCESAGANIGSGLKFAWYVCAFCMVAPVYIYSYERSVP